ncbi:MAG TPA: hypothetical protein VL262_03710 [Vicinamibacterales bacterium]|nr:hypothetical protein [Vicinamibacterales bacterium]
MKSSQRTVDLVVTGDGGDALATVVDAVSRGQRVLLVLRAADTRATRRFRRYLRRGAKAADGQLAVMTNAEVVCVDGVHGVEAVVIRHGRTGHLCAVNAFAFLSFDGRDQLSGVSDKCSPGIRAPRTSRTIQ